MFKNKEVKYLMTGPFDILQEGTIINAILLLENKTDGVGLIYHPCIKGECASLEMCILNQQTGVWESGKENLYINISRSHKSDKFILGEHFKFKRKIYNDPNS